MGHVVKAPDRYDHLESPIVFLAGVYRDGQRGRLGQQVFAEAFETVDVTILNPRRDDWDSSWEQDARQPAFPGASRVGTRWH